MTNRLGNENSPYLLQHADNPVDPGMKMGGPGCRGKIAHIADGAPVGDDLKSHAPGCKQRVGCSRIVEAIENVKIILSQPIPDEADSLNIKPAFENQVMG